MQQIQEHWTAFLDWFGPNRWVHAVVILVVAIVAAKVVDVVVTRILRRIVARTRGDLDDRIVDAIHRPLFQSVVLAGLGLATLALDLPPTVERLTLAVLKTLAVFVVLGVAMRLASVLLELFSAHGKIQLLQPRTLPLFDNLAKVLIVGGAVYFLFLSWDVDVTAWLASAGIVGLAVGFAAKDTLANLFSGVFILADAPYRLGDYIVLDTGERGKVTHVGLRSTRLLTRDDVEVTIPNAVIGNAKIVNEAGGPNTRRRVRVPIGVAYGSDVDQVRQVLTEIAAAEEEVEAEPTPRVRLRGFGDSSLDFELLCWIAEPVLRGKVLDSLNTAIYKRFAVEGIEIPFPQRDVHVRQGPGIAS